MDRHLLKVTGGTILVADTVHGVYADDPSELRRIRRALQRQAEDAGLGSGRAGRALSAVQGLDQLLALTSDELTVLTLDADEWKLAVRLQSRRPGDRAWRHSLGAKARRLDAGESASIAIAVTRSLAFASDDEDALTLWKALSGVPGCRTRDLLFQLVADEVIAEPDAREVYRVLQTDDLDNLGGPSW
ncbi:MAG: hypothetical protein ACRDYB_01660 [Acidimicrobiales bacterium]